MPFRVNGGIAIIAYDSGVLIEMKLDDGCYPNLGLLVREKMKKKVVKEAGIRSTGQETTNRFDTLPLPSWTRCWARHVGLSPSASWCA